MSRKIQYHAEVSVEDFAPPQADAVAREQLRYKILDDHDHEKEILMYLAPIRGELQEKIDDCDGVLARQYTTFEQLLQGVQIREDRRIAEAVKGAVQQTLGLVQNLERGLTARLDRRHPKA